MVQVKPLKGITYNAEKFDSLDEVMSPPYDIISPDMQNSLYEKSPYNFVRLILGKQNDDDTEENNRYTRAKEAFEKWLQESIIIPSKEPAIFPYKIKYNIEDQQKTMSGFFVLLKLDPTYEKVKAHEKTLSKPKADRLNLMRACHANLEPIQLLYIDEEDSIQKTIEKTLTEDPYIQVTGYDQFTHSIWRLKDKSVISKIQEKLQDENLFIADGHHRYQTALNFAEEMKTQNPSDEAPFNYRLVILANMFDEGLAILPTHRLMHMEKLKRERFLKDLSTYFDIEQHKRKPAESYLSLSNSIKKQLETTKEHRFVLYFKDMFYVLRLKDETIMDELAHHRSKTWRTLDVSILHKIIIENILGITNESLEDHVKYTRDDEEALRSVDEGNYDFSFLMNATKIDELKAIAEAGEHMPQKSTYFLPKMLSGLVVYKMDMD
ncbi:MAG: DUF1015 domain-containing protein [Thermoplasmatota archaeon]